MVSLISFFIIGAGKKIKQLTPDPEIAENPNTGGSLNWILNDRAGAMFRLMNEV
jgi:hypothetical protein